MVNLKKSYVYIFLKYQVTHSSETKEILQITRNPRSVYMQTVCIRTHLYMYHSVYNPMGSC